VSEPFPQISVVVPTYNDAARLARLLHSFDRLLEPWPCEIIVVDDCSQDATAAIVHQWQGNKRPCDKRYIKLDANSGPAVARNRGLREAVSKIVAFTDSDCVVDSQWLHHLVRPLALDNRLAGVGGAVLPLQPEGLFGRFNTFFGVLDPPPSLLYLVTANCCYLREPALEAGGFDETLTRPGGEDLVLSYRLWKAGWRFGRSETAVVYHDYTTRLSNFYRTWWNYGFGSGYINEAIIGPEDTPDAIPGETCWNREILAPYRGSPRERLIDVWSVMKAGRARYRSGMTGVKFAVLRLLVLWAYGRGYVQGQAAASRK
jgi:glycosyltransferase involved in cell wall biosynthesis